MLIIEQFYCIINYISLCIFSLFLSFCIQTSSRITLVTMYHRRWIERLKPTNFDRVTVFEIYIFKYKQHFILFHYRKMQFITLKLDLVVNKIIASYTSYSSPNPHFVPLRWYHHMWHLKHQSPLGIHDYGLFSFCPSKECFI